MELVTITLLLLGAVLEAAEVVAMKVRKLEMVAVADMLPNISTMKVFIYLAMAKVVAKIYKATAGLVMVLVCRMFDLEDGHHRNRGSGYGFVYGHFAGDGHGNSYEGKRNGGGRGCGYAADGINNNGRGYLSGDGSGSGYIDDDFYSFGDGAGNPYVDANC